MSSQVQGRIAAEAVDYGFHKVKAAAANVGGNPHALAWQIVCGGCGARYKAAWSPDTSAAIMVRNMHKKGWDVSAKKAPACPTCIHKAKVIPMTAKANGGASLGEASAVKFLPPGEKAEFTSPAPRIQRAVFSLLDDRFDEGTHLYRDGWTDERVAKEVGTTPDVVKRLRIEGGYGELAEDPRVSALKDDLVLLRLEVEEHVKAFNRKVDDLASRVAGLGGGGI